ncbi:hypothetical protein [Desulfobulbus sp.]|uniref:hypothetical protein n=1 Tax=Desulfobulbus sp. TaxID=895 RepID=UPI00286EF5E1|nr:hypothetical protein [Desulfobulbus sp.]
MSDKTEMQTGDLWDALGSLADDQATQVLAHLFTRFEQRWQQCPDDPAPEAFFRMLAVAVEHVQSCNINRR